MYAGTGQGLCWLRTASVHEGSPEGDKNEEGLYNIEQRNKFSVGEEIEVMKPDGTNLLVTVKRITDEKGVDMESCPHPKQQLYIDLGVELERYDILRRKEE